MVVSVIIPNWNGKHFLKTCLDSLKAQTYKEFDIIIVDNGSMDGSVEFIKENHPEVKIVQFHENKGFSAAVNAGIKMAKGNYIALLNNDTEVDPRWLEELTGALERHPEVGFCASKMVNYYKRGIIDTAGDGFSRYGMGYKRGSRKPDGPEFNKMEYIFGACAGAAIYRRRLFDEVGLFDEEFFAYLEDVDLSFRSQLRGFKCLYVPKAVVYHIGGGTTGGKSYSLKRIAWKTKNKIFLLIKDMPTPLLIKNLPFISFAYLIELSALMISLIVAPRTFFKVMTDLMKNLPVMFSRRREIQSSVVVSKEYLAELFSKEYSI